VRQAAAIRQQQWRMRHVPQQWLRTRRGCAAVQRAFCHLRTFCRAVTRRERGAMSASEKAATFAVPPRWRPATRAEYADVRAQQCADAPGRG